MDSNWDMNSSGGESISARVIHAVSLSEGSSGGEDEALEAGTFGGGFESLAPGGDEVMWRGAGAGFSIT